MGFLTTTDINKQPSPLAITDQALTDLMLDEYLNRSLKHRMENL